MLSLICGFWELIFGLHDWEEMLLIIEPPLQAHVIILIKKLLETFASNRDPPPLFQGEINSINSCAVIK